MFILFNSAESLTYYLFRTAKSNTESHKHSVLRQGRNLTDNQYIEITQHYYIPLKVEITPFGLPVVPELDGSTVIGKKHSNHGSLTYNKESPVHPHLALVLIQPSPSPYCVVFLWIRNLHTDNQNVRYLCSLLLESLYLTPSAHIHGLRESILIVSVLGYI